MTESFHQPRSFWEKTAKTEFESTPLSGTLQVDVAIMGAGFAGLSAALHLSESGLSVAVLDKGGPGWGGSGRNGGQVNPGWKRSRASIEAEFGETAGPILQVCNDATDLVFDLLKGCPRGRC